MRSALLSVLGIGALGLALSTTLVLVGAADDGKDVQIRGKTYQARSVNGRTFLAQGIDSPVNREASEVVPIEDQQARQRHERAVEQRRAERKEVEINLKKEFERLTGEGKHEAAAEVGQDLKLSALEGQVENANVFISEYYWNNELLLKRIDSLEKRIKELEAKSGK